MSDRARDEDTSDEVDDRERRAVDEATASFLGRESRHDAHGEIAPDPYPHGDETRPDREVMARHREEAGALQTGSTSGRSAADPIGMETVDADGRSTPPASQRRSPEQRAAAVGDETSETPDDEAGDGMPDSEADRPRRPSRDDDTRR